MPGRAMSDAVRDSGWGDCSTKAELLSSSANPGIMPVPPKRLPSWLEVGPVARERYQERDGQREQG